MIECSVALNQNEESFYVVMWNDFTTLMGKVKKKKKSVVTVCVEFYHYCFLKKMAVEYMYLIAYKCIIFERKTNILVYIGCLWEEDPVLTEGIGW